MSSKDAITKDMTLEMIRIVSLEREITLDTTVVEDLADKAMDKIHDFSLRGVKVWCSAYVDACEQKTIFYCIIRNLIINHFSDL